MASSEVDQKFLGTFAKNIEKDNFLLSSMLFKVLGLSVLLSKHVVRARKQRKLDPTRSTPSLDLYLRIIYLSREGLRMVEQYIIPMVSTFSELKVLSYKIRASFYHIYVLFHNQPIINQTSIHPKRPNTPPGLTSPHQPRIDKGKYPQVDTPLSETSRSSVQPTHQLQGGPVGGINNTPNTNPTLPPTIPAADFLVPAQNFIPVALQYFRDAYDLSEKHLWGSHPLRLSVKVEFAAFLYDCMHDHVGSRNLAQATIEEVYKAQEGMDDEMFDDAAEMVDILERMAKRGLSSSARSLTSDDGGGSTTGMGASPSLSGSGKTITTGVMARPVAVEVQIPGSMGLPPKPAFPSSDMVNPI